MHVLITGATGMVGSRLTAMLREAGADVSVLTSSENKQNVKQKVFYWSPGQEIFPSELISRPDAVIHLAGANLSSRRWSDAYKNEIIRSRTESSRFLLQQLLKLDMLPARYISASGTDYYPNPGQKTYVETDGPGSHFLATVCVQWEDVADAWQSAGVATTVLRTPVVLAAGQGFMKEMTRTAALGIIPTTGSAGNMLSWIHVEDLCRIYTEALKSDMPGVWNAAAPETATMGELVRTIDRVRGRKTLHPNVPGFALKLLLGEMGSLACTNQKVSSQKLLDTGFRFLYPKLEDAISEIYRS